MSDTPTPKHPADPRAISSDNRHAADAISS